MKIGEKTAIFKQRVQRVKKNHKKWYKNTIKSNRLMKFGMKTPYSIIKNFV